MGKKPRLVLLDAGAVIHAHKCGAWSQLCQQYDVVIPAIVIGEAAFFVDQDGRRVPIDVGPDVTSGRVTKYAAPASDVALTLKRLPTQLVARIHDGEIEALTYLCVEGTADTAFVSADGGAIEATVVLGVSDVAMSLQQILQSIGLTKNLPKEHTEEFVIAAKGRGGQTLVQYGRR